MQGLLKMAQTQNGPIIRPATGSIAQMKLEDVRRTHAAGLNLNLKPSPTKPANPNQLRFEQLSINGPPSPNHQQYQQYNGHYEKQNGGVPAPPERGSSFSTMQQLSPDRSPGNNYPSNYPYNHSPGYPSQTNANLSQDRGPASPTRPTQQPGKRVSFSNTPPTNPKPNPHMERIAEDPNVSYF